MRKTIDVTVTAEGRDKGKVFRITEMDVWAAENWSLRAATVMNRSNIDIPTEAILAGGILAVAAYGIRGLLSANFDDAKPLLDEMLACVQHLPAPREEPNIVRDLYPGDLEELASIFWLRDQVIELHTGFSVADAISKWMARAPAQDTSQPVTQTSRKRSRRSSAKD